ncbi:MAG: 3-oxoacyl-ACP synthase III, partial [Puniceicoccaceae bacterium]
MRFRHAVIESIAPALPEEIRTSAELEAELAPLYERLRLPAGRLELMTGIRERRYWPPGTRPSAASARAGRAVLERSRITPDQIDVLVHCAVCRDMLEPATATFVHAELGLPAAVQAFDLSNACLGFLNALVLASGLIDSGQIRSALVVSGENGRPLVEETIRRLLAGDLDRRQIKPYFANLTIGSGAVAAVVCHRELAPGGHRIRGGVGLADTSQSHLCQGD